MAEKSSFFNSVSGDRVYNASDFANYFSTLVGTGVFPIPDDSLQVTSNNNMTVNLRPGKAWINGYMYQNTDDLSLTIPTADSLLNRIDRVVIRYSTINRNIIAVIKAGTAASNPVAPTLQRDADIYELAVANIYVSAGATTITTSNITDMRMDDNVCGWVNSLVEKNLTEIFNKYMAQIGILSNLQTAAKTSLVDAINNNCNNIQIATNLLNELKLSAQNTDYNIYQLYLQNYYDNKNSNYRGMFFDGFVNANVIDSANSTVTLDTINKRLVYEKFLGSMDGTSGLSLCGDGMYPDKLSKISQGFVINNQSKIKNIKISLGKVAATTGGFRSDIDMTLNIYNAVNGIPDGNALATSNTQRITYSSPDGLYNFSFNNVLEAGTYAFVVTCTYAYSNGDWFNISYGSNYSDGVCYTCPAQSSSWQAQSADLNFSITYENNDNIYYQSQEQTFEQTMNNSTLYIKSKTAIDCNVSAQIAIYNSGGTVIFNNMTLDSIRDIGNGFQEYKFVISGLTAGNKAKIKITMIRADITIDYYITQYGCILGVA